VSISSPPAKLVLLYARMSDAQSWEAFLRAIEARPLPIGEERIAENAWIVVRPGAAFKLIWKAAIRYGIKVRSRKFAEGIDWEETWPGRPPRISRKASPTVMPAP
jgi:hypothetical protein